MLFLDLILIIYLKKSIKNKKCPKIGPICPNLWAQVSHTFSLFFQHNNIKTHKIYTFFKITKKYQISLYLTILPNFKKKR